jgi:hypothetical protein
LDTHFEGFRNLALNSVTEKIIFYGEAGFERCRYVIRRSITYRTANIVWLFVREKTTVYNAACEPWQQYGC